MSEFDKDQVVVDSRLRVLRAQYLSSGQKKKNSGKLVMDVVDGKFSVMITCGMCGLIQQTIKKLYDKGGDNCMPELCISQNNIST